MDDDYSLRLAEARALLNPPSKQRVKIRKLHPDAIIPTYAHEGDAGADLYAVEDTVIEPGDTAVIKTGISVELPAGYEWQIRPRSGISARTKLRVANAPGTVDFGFKGEVGVIMDNVAQDHDFPTTEDIVLYTDGISSRMAKDDEVDCSYHIRKGERIAQAILAPVASATFVEVDTLDESDRGEGGYGSSGVRNTEESEDNWPDEELADKFEREDD
nr:deoxyuridine 5'-triphosphate nucleotidohydrolase [Thalassobacillus sp. CUG 92003]